MSIASNILDDEFLKKADYFMNVQHDNDLETIWSIHEVDDIYKKCAVKVKGKTLRYVSIRSNASYDDILADIENNSSFTTQTHTTTVHGNTWLDLWKAAEDLILKSGTHHRYIEDFECQDDGSYVLTTGS